MNLFHILGNNGGINQRWYMNINLGYISLYGVKSKHNHAN